MQRPTPPLLVPLSCALLSSALLSCAPSERGQRAGTDAGSADTASTDEGIDSDSGSDSGSDGGDDSAADPPWCADPADAVTYTEVGEAWDLLDTAGGGNARMETNPVALFDLDGDGDDDLLLADDTQGLWLHRTGPDGFTRSQLQPWMGLTTLGLADVDGDRDLDVVAGDRDGRLHLLANDGAGNLSDATAGSGLDAAGISASIRDLSFGDADGDGVLDLAVVVGGMTERPEDRSRVLLGDGLGGFGAAFEPIPADSHVGLGWQALWFDLEVDGDTDLFYLNAEQSRAGPSRLLRNDGAAWTDLTESCDCGYTGSNMGGSAGDVDGDGLLDIFLANTGPSNLLGNQGDGTFVDLAFSLGATAVPDSSWMGFGSAFFDRDNDGDLDILLTTGILSGTDSAPGQTAAQADVLLERQGERFVDVGAELGLGDTGHGRGLAYGLLDGDGHLDLVVNHVGSASQVHLATCDGGRALVLDLQGPAPNTFGAGARIEVETSAGLLVREVRSRAGWASAVHPRAHFGLGDATVSRVAVHWPDGTVQELELPGRPDRRVTVRHPELAE